MNNEGTKKRRWDILVLSALLSGSGCTTSDSKTAWQYTPAFIEPQIRSLTWKDAEGKPLELLEWCILDLKHHGELLIVKYGYAETKTTVCMDFYRVDRRLTDLEEYDRFVLLEHDFGHGMVTSVEPEWHGMNVWIAIRREGIPGKDRPRYQLSYERAYTLRNGFGSLASDLMFKIGE